LTISIARIYDISKHNSQRGDYRILVDRLWPRGIKKDDVKLDLWLKDIAPSSDLRKWFGHEIKKWEKFKILYFKELDKNQEIVNQLRAKAKDNSVIFLYGAKNENFNHAVALKEYLSKKGI
jgi:uncharacterized protein YeaO (DUF488 family)